LFGIQELTFWNLPPLASGLKPEGLHRHFIRHENMKPEKDLHNQYNYLTIQIVTLSDALNCVEMKI
jgi:hypothetical protein